MGEAVTRARRAWLDAQARRREAMRAWHDDLGHSWAETATRFGVSADTVRQLAYRARRERAKEMREARRASMPAPPPLPPRPERRPRRTD